MLSTETWAALAGFYGQCTRTLATSRNSDILVIDRADVMTYGSNFSRQLRVNRAVLLHGIDRSFLNVWIEWLEGLRWDESDAPAHSCCVTFVELAADFVCQKRTLVPESDRSVGITFRLAAVW